MRAYLLLAAVAFAATAAPARAQYGAWPAGIGDNFFGDLGALPGHGGATYYGPDGAPTGNAYRMGDGSVQAYNRGRPAGRVTPGRHADTYRDAHGRYAGSGVHMDGGGTTFYGPGGGYLGRVSPGRGADTYYGRDGRLAGYGAHGSGGSTTYSQGGHTVGSVRPHR